MSYDRHIRNPTSMSDYAPPVKLQARLTGTSQTGRLVIIGNPISYVVEPGRYYPFLSLRGHDDPETNAIRDTIALHRAMGLPFPSPHEPAHAASQEFYQNLAAPSTAGAVQRPPRRPMPNTTINGIGPEGLPPPYAPLPGGFFHGIPSQKTRRI